MAIANPSQIAGQVLEDVVNRMADLAIGFNIQLAATMAAKPRYAANAAFLLKPSNALVFPAGFIGTSPNVLLAPLDIDSWMGTSPTNVSQALLVEIYVINGINQQNTKGLLFDGLVGIGIECHVNWPNTKVVYDFDAPVSAIEDTIFAIFNTNTAPYQFWSHGSIYNGRLSMPARSQLVSNKGSGFMQMTMFVLSVGLYK